MGWFGKPREERHASIEAHRAARKAAEAGTRKFGLRDESPVSAELNALVIETEKNVPWWRR